MGSLRPPYPRRLTAREAEQLLTGQPVAPDRRGLARLLSAAAAPARPGELAGERTAVEAFRRAYHGPVEPRRRFASALRRTVLVKVSAGAAVLFLGGTALAAGTGELPAPAQQSAHDLLSPLGVPAPRRAPGTSGVGRARDAGPAAATGSASPAGPDPGSGPGAGQAGDPAARPSPSPDLAQLCRGYLAALAHHESPDPAVRQQLATAAGDVHRIPEFCVRLLHVNPPGDTGPDHHAPPRTAATGPPGLP